MVVAGEGHSTAGAALLHAVSRACKPFSTPTPPHSTTHPLSAGQVQDVGLIFLSAMASAVVQQCGEAGWGEADTLATVLATLTLATAVVGVLIVGTGGCGWVGH